MKTDATLDTIVAASEPVQETAKITWEVSVEVRKSFNSETGEAIESRNTWIKDANGRCIALMTGSSSEANARLIAAAPALLAALELYAQASNLETARAAIDRAKGAA